MNHKKCVAIIGSQSTPDSPEYPIGELMRQASRKLVYELNYDLTSGGAKGADSFAEEGLGGESEIVSLIEAGRFDLILPKAGFNGKNYGITITDPAKLSEARQILIDKVYSVVGTPPRAITIPESQVSSLTGMEHALRRNFTRNVFQILRRDLMTPINMVICWTQDGCISAGTYKPGRRMPDGKKIGTGGTGIAICLADALKIPVFNLEVDEHRKRICDFVGMEYFERPKPVLEDSIQIGLF